MGRMVSPQGPQGSRLGLPGRGDLLKILKQDLTPSSGRMWALHILRPYGKQGSAGHKFREVTESLGVLHRERGGSHGSCLGRQRRGPKGTSLELVGQRCPCCCQQTQFFCEQVDLNKRGLQRSSQQPEVETTHMLIDRRLGKQGCSIHTLEYYSTLKKNKEPMAATAWLQLENILLSQKSQAQEATFCIILFIWNVRNRQIHRHRN